MNGLYTLEQVATRMSLSLLLLAGAVAGAAETGPLPATLQNAPVNRWVKVVEMKTGAREQPVFVYAAKAGRFVAAAGMQSYFGGIPRHYDTEELDLGQAKWFNAYPPGMDKDRPESGPIGDDYTKQRDKQGHGGASLFYKDGDYLRIGAGGQWHDGKTYGEYCYVPEGGTGGQVYACMATNTLRYDVAARMWTNLNAKARAKCNIWGSLCYDPVNREILHAGGDGGTADTSTWVYSLEKNEWRQLEFGSARLKELFGKSKELCWQAKDLLGRTSSRQAVAETAAEAKVDLCAKASEFAVAAEKFGAEIVGAGLVGGEKHAGEVAAQRLNAAAAAVKAAGPTLSGAITPEKIAAVRSAREVFEQVVDALAVEPPGRARSQIALDAASNKIVLFGGDGLDRVLSDTWVYDCKTRTWEQRFPAKSPAPRAGHILGWLPGAKRIVMAGGYSRVPLAQEIWSYDVGANEWTALMHVPLADRISPNCPNVTAREYQIGAVGESDVVVCFNGNTVWACKVDPAKPAAGAEAADTVSPGAYVFNTIDPAIWEKVAQPDPEKSRKFLDDLPVNQWTTLKFPKYAPGANNRWGTTAYDTDRHQFLFWGGGHATSHENDVGHYSVLGGCWTIGYHPDEPIEPVYANQPTPLSFHDRCHVPVHAYRAYTYDATVGKMLYFDRAYDPLVREWIPTPFPGLEHLGTMHSQLKATPAGAVCFSTKGLFRFNATTGSWGKLPWAGPKPSGFDCAWCDGPAMTYDSKRNCLWLAQKDAMYKYDFASGTSEMIVPVKPNRPKTGDGWLICTEAAYLPESDLVLAMWLVKRGDGKAVNYAWNPADGKFYYVELTFVDNGKNVEFKDSPFGLSDAMAYDPEFKLILVNNSSAFKVWALKFDSKAVKMMEIAD